ncbi:hypothetical protein KVV02_002735 [Mortierella alpina]|uniref:Promethin n=1 Tax=Mortierella alpina TaxID=64518 RepID=A0A9P7ZWK5_MORAP|nr:hypothetical protein KVV02_002735 [Mortierella alpina]
MTQQVDPKSSSAQPGRAEPHTAFAFESQGDAGSGSSGADRGGNDERDGEDAKDRWPSLLNIRQVVVAFILEAVSDSRPLRNKLNAVILRAGQRYVIYAQAHPLPTILLSSLIMFSAAPIVIFACVTGASLGILVGTAALVVIVLQSIIVSIAGAALLFTLGVILIMTTFAFFWLVVLHFGYRSLKSVIWILQEQRVA